MNEFVRKPPEERRLFFEQAAMRRNWPAFAVEKDFWVCWTLRALFSLPEGKRRKNRMARHYDDVYCMIRKGVADRAISDRQLLGLPGA